jgi:hypothetical protein
MLLAEKKKGKNQSKYRHLNNFQKMKLRLQNWPGIDVQLHPKGEGCQWDGKTGDKPIQDRNLRALQN